MEPFRWVRGEVEIEHVSYARVSKATVVGARNVDVPRVMTVKTTEASSSSSVSLREEKRILNSIGASPRIVRCFGASTTIEKEKRFYNVFFEFVPRGSLADEMWRRRSELTGPEVRRYARAVLEGLSVIHAKGFVHCDIRPGNIVISDDGEAKIADFWIAKDRETKAGRRRGNPLYTSPEAWKESELEPPCDIWALGCLVLEIATGAAGSTSLKDIAGAGGVSVDGRDFLSKCFVKDPKERWTAQMLLSHPFVMRNDDDIDSKAEMLRSHPLIMRNDEDGDSKAEIHRRHSFIIRNDDIGNGEAGHFGCCFGWLR